MLYSSASQRVFDIRELRELIFDYLEPQIHPADAARYVRVGREWYSSLIGSLYECLKLKWEDAFVQWRLTTLLDTLASRPHLAEMVGHVIISMKLPFHCFRLVLDVCVNMASLSFSVNGRIPLAYHPSLPSGAGLSVTSLHLALPYFPYHESDGLEALFSCMTSLRSLRLDQARTWDVVCSVLTAISPTVQKLHLQSPAAMLDTEQDGTAELWRSYFVSLPALTSLHVEGRAKGLAAAGFTAPPSLQRLEVSFTYLSDYAALIENFTNATWFPGLSTLPKFTIIGADEVSLYVIHGLMADIQATPVISELMATLNAGLRAMNRRSSMMWDEEAAADLRSLPRAGWELYRTLLSWHGPSPDREIFTDLYGDQFHQDSTEAE